MILTEIHCAVELYFEVMHECDLEKFDRIFHPASSLFAVHDGALILRPFQTLTRFLSIISIYSRSTVDG